MLNVANKPFMLNVVMLNAVMLSVMAAKIPFLKKNFTQQIVF
jgi:hypothetical protein